VARWRLLPGRRGAEEAEGAGMGTTEGECLEMGLGSFLKFSFGGVEGAPGWRGFGWMGSWIVM
jgi:hypothetical protein